MEEQGCFQQAELEPVSLRAIAGTSDEDLSRLVGRFRGILSDLELRLTAYLRSAVGLKIASTEERHKAVEEDSPEPPGNAVSLKLVGGEARAVVSLGPQLVALLLDLILGGDGRRVEPRDRPCTDLERSLLRPFHEILAGGVSSLLGADGAVIDELTPGDREEGSPGSSRRIVFAVELRCHEVSETFRISLPIEWLIRPATSEPSLEHLDGTGCPALILDRLEGSPVQIEPVLTGVSIRIADLLKLQPDDLLVFDCSVETPLHLSMNGLTQVTGHLAERNGRRAFVVDSVSTTQP